MVNILNGSEKTMKTQYGFTGRQFVERLVSLWDSPAPDGTVDRFVLGDPDGIVTGIATTFIASMDCLREAVRRHHVMLRSTLDER